MRGTPVEERALLLDAAKAGPRLVATGAQGVILLSEDSGTTWTQATTPTRDTLTCVAFADDNLGWAAGHGGLLLGTTDGGLTWSALEAAAAPEDSFLDLLAAGDGRILAAGAYGLYRVSDDNGRSWSRQTALEEDFHINRLTRGASGRLYLAGEAGTLAVSTDRGATWEQLASPYEGSFFGLTELSDGRLFAHGLRGHAYVSADEGQTWTQVDVQHPVLLMTAVEPVPGTLVMGGNGNNILVGREGIEAFDVRTIAGLNAVAELLPVDSGRLLAVGDGGCRIVSLASVIAP